MSRVNIYIASEWLAFGFGWIGAGFWWGVACAAGVLACRLVWRLLQEYV